MEKRLVDIHIDKDTGEMTAQERKIVIKGVEKEKKKVWELAGLISLMTNKELQCIFDCCDASNVFHKLSFAEALAKYEEYKKNILEVGDIIFCERNNSYGLITYKAGQEYNVLWDDGSLDTFFSNDIQYDGIKNTGEKFDVIELLRKIKGNKI